jgi:hypothetical protein
MGRCLSITKKNNVQKRVMFKNTIGSGRQESPIIVPSNDPWGANIYTLKDALMERKPIQYIVEGLFPRPSLSIVYGAPATFKSFMLADMAMCVADGKMWLEPLPDEIGNPFATEQTGVFWIDFDNGDWRTHERMRALAVEYGMEEDLQFVYTSMPSPQLDALDKKAMGQLGKRIEKLQSGLVIVDNLGITSGDVEENSNKMAQVMNNWRQLVNKCNVAVILIHHQTKNGGSSRIGASLRGHSSIEAAVDLALLVERDDQSSPIISIQATKTRGAGVPPFSALYRFQCKPGTRELERAGFVGAASEEDLKNREVRKEVFRVVSENPGIKKGDLVQKVHEKHEKFGIAAITGLVEDLESNKKLEMKSGLHGSKNFWLPSHAASTGSDAGSNSQKLREAS